MCRNCGATRNADRENPFQQQQVVCLDSAFWFSATEKGKLSPTVQENHIKRIGEKMKRSLPALSPYILPPVMIKESGETNKKEQQKAKNGIKRFQRECVYLFSLISSGFKALAENCIILVLCAFIKLHVFL